MRKLWIVLLSLLIIPILSMLLFYFMSRPLKSGTITSEFLNETVNIYFDQYSIPSTQASSLESAWYSSKKASLKS